MQKGRCGELLKDAGRARSRSKSGCEYYLSKMLSLTFLFVHPLSELFLLRNVLGPLAGDANNHPVG